MFSKQYNIDYADIYVKCDINHAGQFLSDISFLRIDGFK